MVVLSRASLIDFDSFTTVGLLNNPATFSLKEGMTVTDAIILSGGFKNNADLNKVVISRNKTTDNGLELIENIELSFDENYQTNNDFLIKKNDVITVRGLPYDRPAEFFTISGEVSVPGKYSVYKSNLSVNEILNNLDFTNNANSNQIHMLRDGIKVPISLYKKNVFFIKDGDNLIVPKKDNTIKVNGAVQQVSILDFNSSKSFKKSVINSGGFANNADKKRSYVIYPNGLKKQTRSFLFFKIYPQIIPGSELIIPTKKEKESRNAAEIIGITSSITSLVAIIRLITQ